MYVQIGGYTHGTAEAGVVFTAEQVRSARGEPYIIRKRMSISGLLIPTAGEGNMTTAIENLEAAYVDGHSCGLYQTDGTQTPHFLDNGTSLGGVRVISRSFPNPEEVYSTNRRFAVTLEADYPLGWPRLLYYTETVQLIGAGGPYIMAVRLVTGLPDAQVLSQRTETRATQSGMAVGTNYYPPAPMPLWPNNEQQADRNISYTAPTKRDGYYCESTTRWSYNFVGIEPFQQIYPNPGG